MDLKPMSNLHKPRTKRSGENSKGIWMKKGKLVVAPDSNREGCLNSHDLAKYEALIDVAGSSHGQRGLAVFPNNGSSSSAGFGNSCSLKFPPTKLIPDAISTPFEFPPEKPDVHDQLKTKVGVYVPEVNFEDAVAEYPFVPEPVFPIDVSETEPYYPLYKPPQSLFPCEFLPFDEAFIKDSDDWILDFMSDPSFNAEK